MKLQVDLITDNEIRSLCSQARPKAGGPRKENSHIMKVRAIHRHPPREQPRGQPDAQADAPKPPARPGSQASEGGDQAGRTRATRPTPRPPARRPARSGGWSAWPCGRGWRSASSSPGRYSRAASRCGVNRVTATLSGLFDRIDRDVAWPPLVMLHRGPEPPQRILC